MVVVIEMMMMKINFLSGMMAIKNRRLKKFLQKKSSYALIGTPQGTGIGVCQKTKKVMEKNCGDKYRPFLRLVTVYNIFFERSIKFGPCLGICE